jgi:hypothetical protein
MKRFGRRLQVTALLSAGGAVVGALTAAALSFLATAVANAMTPVGHIEYYYGPIGFAIVGAIGTPALTWLLMRRAPLWRAVIEPAIGGMLGTLLALSSVALARSAAPLVVQPLCVLAGIAVAALRLRHANADRHARLAGAGMKEIPAQSPHAS